MTRTTDEEKEAAKRALPEQIRAFLDSEELKESYKAIQASKNLNLRQMGVIMEAATDALLGLLPESDVQSVLSTELAELPHETQIEILREMDGKIFQPARARLRAE